MRTPTIRSPKRGRARSPRRACALGLALLGIAAAAPLPAAKPTQAPPALVTDGAIRPVKDPTSIYMVKLKSAGAASYQGTLPGFAATKPRAGQRLDRTSGPVATYANHLEETHDRLLAALGARHGKVYSYRYAFNGFAARLTAAEASKLAHHADVERIWSDTEQYVQTNNSSVFLGLLDQDGGLRADEGLRGEGIVIGVIDSGIAADHPSLRDHEERVPRLCQSEWAEASWLGLLLCRGYKSNPDIVSTYTPPAGFNGTCQEGEGFTAAQCNNKLVGARYYIDGFLFRNDLDANEFISPKDADGHGTHIATILAGNRVPARLFGTRVAEIGGIAPRAHVAVYKACWLKPGETRASCATSDLARAIDDAVADGVDIINYSVGSLETDLTAPDDFALLNALDAGILSVVAAGNDGPDLGTIGSPSSAPWVLTVAASTQSGTRFEEAISITAPDNLAGEIEMREASFTPQLVDRAALEAALALADDGTERLGNGLAGNRFDACEPLENPGALESRIALIARGGCDFQVKLARVEQAGAAGAVVFNNVAGAPIVMNGDVGSVGIPAVMIPVADGQRLVDRLVASPDLEITVLLDKGEFIARQQSGNEMSLFSSRGPGLSEWDFLKPDVTAPGVDILGGHTPDVANGLTGETFQYLTGTSQSAPHVAGVAALLKEAHPDWSPSALKSALMTTAYQGVTRPEDEAPADPFDMGAGHIDANRALDPGLVYDADFLDHAAYLCGLDASPFPDAECDILAGAGYSFEPRELNLPSIGVGELISGDEITRVVTNVGPSGRYQVSVTPPPGVGVAVTPETLNLGSGESGAYTVSFAVQPGAEREAWSFGRLTWSDGEHEVGSPIAVQPVLLRTADEIALDGASGEDFLPVDFGYDGEYAATVHGLHAPFLHADGFVDDDAENDFAAHVVGGIVQPGNGVTAHHFVVEPGDLFMRVALFDALTDGDDDLDLYLFYCRTDTDCTQIGQSGSFTSNEQIDLTLPLPGRYAAVVHGFETDQTGGGPGANYEIFAWSFATNDDAGNFRIAAPDIVDDGALLDLGYDWGPLAPGELYLGAVAHDTPFGIFFLTIVTADTLP